MPLTPLRALRARIVPPVAQRLLSRERLLARRARAERERIARGEPHRVRYFHQVDDPHAALAAAALPALLRRYDVVLEPSLVGAPADDVAPERALLLAWARRDAALLARHVGLDFVDPGRQPDPAAVDLAAATLARAIPDGRFADVAGEVSARLWRGEPPVSAGAALADRDSVEAACAAGDALRTRLGHYLGATFHYGGEWYWGIDRLHHLEARLQALGAARPGTGGVLFPPDDDSDPDGGADDGHDGGTGPADDGSTGPSDHDGRPGAAPIDFWFSLRSPYSAIAAPRVLRLARQAGAPLRLRFVLPMVMRGLPVPRAKRTYIAADAAREAHVRGVPFGRVLDPVGRPTERGLALFPLAERAGVGRRYLLSAMHGIWAEGLDPGSDAGLRTIATRAGLDWNDCRAALADDGWRATAEANRADLFARGLWGVPSCAVGEVAVWGQDRLWAIRDALGRGKDANVPGSGTTTTGPRR